MLMETATSRYARTIAQLEAESRRRSLTECESRELEEAIRRSRPSDQRVYFVWLPKHDLLIAKMLRRSPRPSVALLAQTIGVSEGAMWRRLHILRKAGKIGYFSAPGGTGRYSRGDR